jgi:hypothetical protein
VRALRTHGVCFRSIVGIAGLPPKRAERRGTACVLFFAGALLAGLPWLNRDAPYSFWVFACVFWLCLGVVLGFLRGLME